MRASRTGRWWLTAVAAVVTVALGPAAPAAPGTGTGTATGQRDGVASPRPGALAGGDRADLAPVRPGDPAAAAALVAAWERAAAGTFVVRSSFERRLAGGATLSAESVLAQRPPDRLRRQAGTVSGRLGGRLVACTEVEGRHLPCVDAGPAPAYAVDVATEVAAVRRLVSGLSSPYAVTGGGSGCFALRLRVWGPAPVYGTAARFCFDRATGAPVRTEVTRPEGTDVTVALELRRPTSADFHLPG